MGEVFEVVFECDEGTDIFQLICSLKDRSKGISNFQCGENFDFMAGPDFSKASIRRIVDFDGSLAMLFHLKELNFDGALVNFVQFRLVKYDARFDVELSFDIGDLDPPFDAKFVGCLHGFSNSLALTFGISCFYAGMEPASDLETRLFTNDKLGPICKN